MESEHVRISAPSRIHFGLLSPGGAPGRQFGGAGVMVAQPRTEVVLRRAHLDSVAGPHAERARQFIASWQSSTGSSLRVACEVLTAPPQHVGLGLGTQLGMAIATALETLAGRHDAGLIERAVTVRRGLRSAVGVHGFQHGGLIVEQGKCADEPIGAMSEHIQLPAAWRLLLVCPRAEIGLAGKVEEQAFESLPQVSADVQRGLRATLFEELVPAARAGDFPRFGESLYRYGFLAGECFAEPQGGPFLSQRIADIVEFARRRGVAGVGQSSWGPTVYAWFRDESAAIQFSREVGHEFANLSLDLTVTPVDPHGAIQTFF